MVINTQWSPYCIYLLHGDSLFGSLLPATLMEKSRTWVIFSSLVARSSMMVNTARLSWWSSALAHVNWEIWRTEALITELLVTGSFPFPTVSHISISRLQEYMLLKPLGKSPVSWNKSLMRTFVITAAAATHINVKWLMMFQITILLAFFASRENDREKDPLFL